MATPSEHARLIAGHPPLTPTLYLYSLGSDVIGEIPMCGERDETTGGEDVIVATQAKAEQAVTGGQRPVYYNPRLDCLVPWFDLASVEEPPPPSEASCADWQAGFIGLAPKAPPAPPPPLSIPLRALGHHPGSAPLIEHLASTPRRRSVA